MDLTKEQYADNAIEFLQTVARTRLSSEYGEDEDPKPPEVVLNSLIMEARRLAGQEKGAAR